MVKDDMNWTEHGVRRHTMELLNDKEHGFIDRIKMDRFLVTPKHNAARFSNRGLKMRRNGSSEEWYGSVCFALDLAGALSCPPI
ncbi:hypothetical protein EVAR_52780_1 [Eumeta japonica]|uniref:Uncharacterized protein n=1 Tax=Eumeta variegata TaxID=151549 RepID=A0A4C1Z364_EUMVA|nr:hypothetical protein EVAR_52780_1 [Eumeta japonica]